jgi:hypothetical protein
MARSGAQPGWRVTRENDMTGMKIRRLVYASTLVLILNLPLHAQWEVGAGVEYADSPRMGWSTFVTRLFDGDIGWTGEASGVTNASTAFWATGAFSQSTTTTTAGSVVDTHRKKKGFGHYKNWLGDWGTATTTTGSAQFDASSGEAQLSTYTFTTGPTIRLYSRGSIDLDCRGTVGTIYRDIGESDGFWRFASRDGCGIAYNFDSESAVRVTADYLYASPGSHVPVIAARFYVKF